MHRWYPVAAPACGSDVACRHGLPVRPRRDGHARARNLVRPQDVRAHAPARARTGRGWWV